ncbi:MAG TPA: peptidoglycan recognition family protein [Polyangia bacterium]|nr:peptidoglycan recognition family protein [Polyangia bacterium]
MFALALVAGCAGAPARPESGPVAQGIEQAAARNGLPRDLVLAVAAIEGGLWLSPVRVLRVDDDVPVAGALELRHGAFNSLARGAELMGTDEATLRIDTDRGTEAGARVLAELAHATGAHADDLGSYRAALEELSGLSDANSRADYAARVLAVVRSGGVFPARAGEQVFIDAHPDVSVPALGVRHEAASGTPDYPGAIWFSTSCSGKCDTTRTAGNSVVNMIAIHDTEGGWDASVATLQNDAGKSVHYIVDADGSRVGQFVPETYTAWHVGNYYYNQRMVGIEHVGFAAATTGYSDGLYQASVKLVKNIRTRWNVPLDRQHILGHYQVPDGTNIAESSPACSDTLDHCETSANYGGASNHRDPGYYWQWCQYMERLGGSCDCNDTYPLWNCTTDATEAVRCSGGKVEIDHCTAGCVSKPVGTDDVCNHAPPPPPSDGGTTGGTTVPGQNFGGIGNGNGESGGENGGGGNNPGGPAGHTTSGCSFAGAGASSGNLPQGGTLALIALAIFAATRRARRRAAPLCAAPRGSRRADRR